MTRGFGGGLAGLRYRRLISFLRRNQLHATAHALERQTGVFFDAAHLRRMLLDGRYVPASSYARRFVTVRDCSPEADKLNFLILLLRVIADCAGAGPTTEDDLFRRIYSSLGAHSRCHAIRKLLLSMRSDCIKASMIHRRIKPKVVQTIMDLVAKCPELQAKARLPRCTYDPAYIMSLGPRLQRCTSRHKNKIRHIPANVLARSFLQHRPPPPVSGMVVHSELSD